MVGAREAGESLTAGKPREAGRRGVSERQRFLCDRGDDGDRFDLRSRRDGGGEQTDWRETYGGLPAENSALHRLTAGSRIAAGVVHFDFAISTA